MAPASARASETNEWTFDLSIYGLALGMEGELGIGPVTADVEVGLEDILNNLEFGIMGTVRVGYGPWAITTEGLYMGLEGEKDGVTAELDQWMVEPTLSYRVSKYFEPFVGTRFNTLKGELRGPGVLPEPVIPSGTQNWWDPDHRRKPDLAVGQEFQPKAAGDVGGFGVGSDFTWQVYPYFNWQFARWGSLQLGYRWLYMDYETGSGADRFEYDMLNQGAQLGFTFHF